MTIVFTQLDVHWPGTIVNKNSKKLATFVPLFVNSNIAMYIIFGLLRVFLFSVVLVPQFISQFMFLAYMTDSRKKQLSINNKIK